MDKTTTISGNGNGNGASATRMSRAGLHFLVRLLPYIPDKMLMKIMSRWTSRLQYPGGREWVERLVLFVKEIFSNRAKPVRKKVLENFLINYLVTGTKIRRGIKEREGWLPPVAVVISPIMTCNLRCYGCYAHEYTKHGGMSIETLNDVIRQCKELGMYFITISGGEPFFMKGIMDVFAEHDDCYFQVYTNGTLITDERAKQLAELGNVMPCISVEGFEKETDARRGPGTFAKVMAAMKALKRHGAVFAYSATATRENNEFIVSDEFVDFFVEQGCSIGWYFHYMPVGKAPCLELMPTPEQRMWRLDRINELRRTKAIVISDFWNDGPLVGGCIAGGRCYFHINVHGDVEACVFNHFAADNIYKKPLKEALQSRFFKGFQEYQKSQANTLCTCMVIDRSPEMKELVARTGAYPTHEGADITHKELHRDLQLYAEAYKALTIPWCEKHSGSWWKNNGAKPADAPAEPPTEPAEEDKEDAVRL
ncbi:MAG: radical SAM protein [Verrucomicrobia bacterium]|nr:radical SAM protein [Verrucomicrobiota bacterium]